MSRATPPVDFVIRAARPGDAPAMADVLAAIIAVTGQQRPHDTAFVQARYIDHPDQRACFVAVDSADHVLGFQAHQARGYTDWRCAVLYFSMRRRLYSA